MRRPQPHRLDARDVSCTPCGGRVRVIESALEFDERVVRGVYGWKTRHVVDRNNITSETDMENTLTRIERYYYEQRQLQDKLWESQL